MTEKKFPPMLSKDQALNLLLEAARLLAQERTEAGTKVETEVEVEAEGDGEEIEAFGVDGETPVILSLD